MKKFSEYLYHKDIGNNSNSADGTMRLSRQHIVISNYAWRVIEDDMHAIYNGVINKSKMFNNIITVYHEYSPANLDAFAEQERASLNRALSKLNITDKSDIIASILEEKITLNKDHFIHYKKEYSDKLYLSQPTHRMLMGIPDTSYIAKIYKRPGKYITALLETYATLPFYKREQICLHELYEKISTAIDEQCLCNFFVNGNKLTAYPRMLSTDNASLYNYVICEEENGQFRSTRISNIADFIPTMEKKAFTQSSMDELLKIISQKDIPYIYSDATPIKVKFTTKGLKTYRSIAHQRPHILRSDDEFYYFDCSEAQAKFYFQRFGQDAVIYEPEHLRTEMEIYYKNAHEAYSIK